MTYWKIIDGQCREVEAEFAEPDTLGRAEYLFVAIPRNGNGKRRCITSGWYGQDEARAATREMALCALAFCRTAAVYCYRRLADGDWIAVDSCNAGRDFPRVIEAREIQNGN